MKKYFYFIHITFEQISLSTKFKTTELNYISHRMYSILVMNKSKTSKVLRAIIKDIDLTVACILRKTIKSSRISMILMTTTLMEMMKYSLDQAMNTPTLLDQKLKMKDLVEVLLSLEELVLSVSEHRSTPSLISIFQKDLNEISFFPVSYLVLPFLKLTFDHLNISFNGNKIEGNHRLQRRK